MKIGDWRQKLENNMKISKIVSDSHYVTCDSKISFKSSSQKKKKYHVMIARNLIHTTNIFSNKS